MMQCQKKIKEIKNKNLSTQWTINKQNDNFSHIQYLSIYTWKGKYICGAKFMRGKRPICFSAEHFISQICIDLSQPYQASSFNELFCAGKLPFVDQTNYTYNLKSILTFKTKIKHSRLGQRISGIKLCRK